MDGWMNEIPKVFPSAGDSDRPTNQIGTVWLLMDVRAGPPKRSSVYSV